MDAVAATDSFVLREAQVLDEGGGFTPMDVQVSGGVIEAMAPNLPVGEGPSYDLSGLWLMPGVIDCHVHLGWSTWDTARLLDTSIMRWTLEAADNARRTLEAGVTTVRDAGGVDAGFAEAVDAGLAPGPRVQPSIVLLSQTGGHGDGFLAGPGLEVSAQYLVPEYPGRPPFRVDGADAMRRAVREVLRAGGQWIKLCATGGVLSPHDTPNGAELTAEEIGVAVFEAGRKGRGVMVHANGGEGLETAVEAGVRSIEHGIFLTEAQATAMAAAGCWLVPTLAVIRDAIRWADDGLMPDYAIAKAQQLRAAFGDSVRIAREHGVPIALGSDALNREQHGRNLDEIVLLGQCGFTAEEALLTATARSAELLGIEDTQGRIAPGRSFDAVLLDEDPSDLAVLADGAVGGVFKAGSCVIRHDRMEIGERMRKESV